MITGKGEQETAAIDVAATTSAATASAELIITRELDAPRDLVWQAFAEAERLAQWWGPTGCAIDVQKLEFSPGGRFHYCMKFPDGGTMWGRFVYREIAEPERIVFVNSFSDEAGGLTRAPFTEIWPLEMLNTLTLSEDAGKTSLTLRSAALNATDEERRTFEDGFDSMRQGWGGTWDKLVAYLAREQQIA